MKKIFENLKKRIRNYCQPEEVKSSRIAIFTVDKIEGISVCFAIDFGKTFYVTDVHQCPKMEIFKDLTKGIDLEKFEVEQVKLNALKITKREVKKC